MTRPVLRGLAAATTGLLLLGGTAGCGVFGGGDTKHGSAYFVRTVGLFKNSDVRILGVKVGKVTKITPAGTSVRVDFQYDGTYKVAADQPVAIVAPSIVSDRYVQLPAYGDSGPVLPDHATIDLARTAEPLELDDVYREIDNLNQALGPHGANKKGALSDLLAVTARNLNGNGASLNATLKGVSGALGTLADKRVELFKTITQLQDFTTTIADSDGTVRDFNSQLTGVAAQLADERADLNTAVRELASALQSVAGFVQENKTNLTTSVKNLANVTGVLVHQKRALEELIDTAPTAVSNLQLAYNPMAGTLDTRDNNTTGQANPAATLCALLLTAGQPTSTCTALGLPLGPGNGGGGILPGLPGVPTIPGVTGKQQPATPIGQDPTLGGLLGSNS